MLETDRLLLRDLELSDVEDIHHTVYGNPNVAVPFWSGKLRTLEEAANEHHSPRNRVLGSAAERLDRGPSQRKATTRRPRAVTSQGRNVVHA